MGSSDDSQIIDTTQKGRGRNSFNFDQHYGGSTTGRIRNKAIYRENTENHRRRDHKKHNRKRDLKLGHKVSSVSLSSARSNPKRSEKRASGGDDKRLIKLGLQENFDPIQGKDHVFKSKNVGQILREMAKYKYRGITDIKEKLVKVLN